jgi:hypothetical protein
MLEHISAYRIPMWNCIISMMSEVDYRTTSSVMLRRAPQVLLVLDQTSLLDQFDTFKVYFLDI